MTHVGIDVSKLSLVVAVLRETDKVERRQVGNDAAAHAQLNAWLKGFPGRRFTAEPATDAQAAEGAPLLVVEGERSRCRKSAACSARPSLLTWVT